jgi:hypothetical protein
MDNHYHDKSFLNDSQEQSLTEQSLTVTHTKPVDVLQSINEIKEIFLPSLTQGNIVVLIEGTFEFHPSLDETILKVILYNIFYIITKRLRNDGALTVELKGHDNDQLAFYDEGCDLEDNQNPQGEYQDILLIGVKKLQDFVTYLGWEIDFQYPQKGSNIINLTILPKCNDKNLLRNVVSLIDRSKGFGDN